MNEHNLDGTPDAVEVAHEYRELLFKECAVAGVSFHLDWNDEIWNELEEGTQIALVRDRNNKHDRNAVAVALATDYDGNPENFDFDLILGYIPRSENAEIAALLDAGYANKFSAKINSVRRYHPLDNRLTIAIYLQSLEPVATRPNLLRAKSLNYQELSDMVAELETRGTAFFRWGGFPLHKYQLPEVGEKIVILHYDGQAGWIYLMRVLAIGDKCISYVDNPEKVQCEDDYTPFILTNIMGPLRIKKRRYDFLTGINLRELSPVDYLPEELSDGFNLMFNEYLPWGINRSDTEDIQ